MPDSDTIQPPPSGEPHSAEKYINKLISLINDDKIHITHTDLKKFDPSNLEDHYRMDLKDYQVEVSHSKQASDGKDQYVVIFTNLQNVRENACEKVILAYIYLSDEQFRKFKLVAADFLERKRKEAEEKRLQEALIPVDNILDKIASGESLEKEVETGRDDVLETSDSTQYELNQDSQSEETESNPSADQVNSTTL